MKHEPISPLQAMFDGMRLRFDGMLAQWQRERSETQMTLGKLITALEAMPADARVANLCSAHSYRGYYEDLAFELETGTRPAAELLAECKSAMGRVFMGYKGGEYMMGENTPLWVACCGSTGDKLMDLQPGGGIETAPDE